MSALDEIRAALRALPPAEKGRDRVVLVGCSAQHSIAVARCGKDWENGRRAADYLPNTILRVPVQTASHFDGWAIADVDQRGRWHYQGEEQAA